MDGRPRSVAVVGAGAMGAALAAHLARSDRPITLLGTKFDERAVDAVIAGRPHPALGVPLPGDIVCARHDSWDDALAVADLVVLAVSSHGFPDVVEHIALKSRPEAIWAVATKGWDERTGRAPSEVIADARGTADRVAILAGPALAPEIVAGAPTAFMCAAADAGVAAMVADTVRSS